MDHEFDQKPNDSQDKRQQAKNSFEDLQKLMEQFQITADVPEPKEEPVLPEAEPDEPEILAEKTDIPEEEPDMSAEQPQKQPALSVDELIERAAIASGEAEEEAVTEPAEPAEEPEKPAKQEQPEKLEQTTEPEKPKKTTKPETTGAKQQKTESKQPEHKKTTAPKKKKVIRKKELKSEETQEEREQKEREAILENGSKRRHPDQPAATVNLNQTPKKNKKKSLAAKKRKNDAAAKARRRKKRMLRMGTVVVLLLVAIVLVVSAVKAITGRTKKPAPEGSAIVTEADQAEARKKEGPASQQESKQYLAVKDDDTLPSYAKEYPGLYSDAVDEPNVLSEEKVCYLTFDDGPSSTNTPGILDALKKAKVKATFFVVTSEIDEDTAPLLQRIVDEGHTLCIHANEHEYGKIYASTEAYLADFATAYDKIYELTGYRVQGFRFPGGSNGQVNSSGCYDNIVTEMTRRGFEYYDWNAYDHDAEGGNYTVEELVEYAVHEVEISSRDDVILLMHDTYGKEKTVEALPSIISQLKEAGIKMLPITNSTRPVHFEVNDTTPPEYDETAEEDDTGDSQDDDSDSDSRSSDSGSDEN